MSQGARLIAKEISSIRLPCFEKTPKMWSDFDVLGECQNIPIFLHIYFLAILLLRIKQYQNIGLSKMHLLLVGACQMQLQLKLKKGILLILYNFQKASIVHAWLQHIIFIINIPSKTILLPIQVRMFMLDC